jgi:hypothetical protein
MKPKNTKATPEKISDPADKKMNRKEAIKKTGYIAAATMLILLSSNKAQAETSPAPPTGWPSPG